MKIRLAIQAADAKEMRRQGELAFTMIEIAIAIGVIGFALVAIIGILPTGMNVQKDNREDTVISQDAPYFLDAIRNGTPVSSNGFLLPSTAQGLDFLTNYVQSIQFTYYVNGSVASNITYPNTNNPNWTGAEIVGLLSTPQNNYNTVGFDSNYFDVTATVRALSGPATAQQTGGNTGLSSFMAFTYKMEVMITPFNNFAPDSVNYGAYPLNSPDYIIRYNRWLATTLNAPNTNSPLYFTPPSGAYLTPASGALGYNLFDVRLRFSWPVLQSGNVGPGRQTYRTLVSGQMVYALANQVPGWFFQPQTFTNVIPNGL